MPSLRRPPYQYDLTHPLGSREIRLINITPDVFQAPVRLRINYTTLVPEDQQDHGTNLTQCGTPYEALSYCWGTQCLSEIVLLEECEIEVSPNLESILRHLRLKDRQRSIWVDAICINQNDQAEKMRQIPLMHRVYAQATAVVVWLGDQTPESDLAMQYIEKVCAPVETGKEEMISDEVASRDWPLEHFSTAPMNLEELRELTAFYKLLTRPWWFRAWIVQEMALARNIIVQCGAGTISFSHLRMALLITRKVHPAFALYTDIVERERRANPTFMDDWPRQAINNALNLDYCRRTISQRRLVPPDKVSSRVNDVSWSFWSTRARLCREPHDRTFSILGLTSKKFRDALSSSYQVPIVEHNRNVVRAFIAATKSIDIILHSQHSIWLLDQSSWAPDWSQPERAGVFHLNGQTLKQLVPFYIGDAEMPQGSSLLNIKGRIIGTIQSIRPEVDHLVACIPAIDQRTTQATTSADANVGICRRRRWWVFKREYENGELFCNALTRLPKDDPLWKCHLTLFLTEVANMYRASKLRSTPPLPDTNLLLREDRFENFEPFWDLLEYLLMSRIICMMDDRRLLVAPDLAQPEDVVAVLAGCTNPVVLRRNGEGGTFRLLGDAHVNGVEEKEVRRERLGLSASGSC